MLVCFENVVKFWTSLLLTPVLTFPYFNLICHTALHEKKERHSRVGTNGGCSGAGRGVKGQEGEKEKEGQEGKEKEERKKGRDRTPG